MTALDLSPEAGGGDYAIECPCGIAKGKRRVRIDSKRYEPLPNSINDLRDYPRVPQQIVACVPDRGR
jgi:hypothetical protein